MLRIVATIPLTRPFVLIIANTIKHTCIIIIYIIIISELKVNVLDTNWAANYSFGKNISFILYVPDLNKNSATTVERDRGYLLPFSFDGTSKQLNLRLVFLLDRFWRQPRRRL